MTQKPIASVGPSVGRLKNVDDNFTELYAGAASANTALTTFAATQTAWTTYTATATGQSAVIGGNSVTTASQKADGKTQYFAISSVIASATAACGAILIDLPATANTAAATMGWNSTDNFAVSGIISANAIKISIQATGGGSPGLSQKTVIISGVYQKQ